MKLNQRELQDIAMALMGWIEDLEEGEVMHRLLNLYNRVSKNIKEGPHAG